MYGSSQNATRPTVGLLSCLYLQIANHDHGLPASLVLNLGKHFFLGGSHIDARYLLQLETGILFEQLQLASGTGQFLLAADQHRLPLS